MTTNTPALDRFNQTICGRPGAIKSAVAADTDGDYLQELATGSQRMYTPRQANQARGIGYAMREAYRYANRIARQREAEAATADAPAYQWKPDRPARR